MILFSITWNLAALANPLIHHQSRVKYVPLKEFTNYPRRYVSRDVENIKKIALQPTKPLHLHEDSIDQLIDEQPLHLRGRKTIVLDLDETLFSVNKVKRWNDDWNDSALRPFHKPFINACKNHFEVVVWTRSSYPYAKRKCEWLGLDDVPMITGWEGCDELGAKPLYKLNRADSQMLLIDDDKVHLSANPRSQLLITPWTGEANDCELENLIPIITKIAKEPTVQHVLDICLAHSYRYRSDSPSFVQ